MARTGHHGHRYDDDAGRGADAGVPDHRPVPRRGCHEHRRAGPARRLRAARWCDRGRDGPSAVAADHRRGYGGHERPALGAGAAARRWPAVVAVDPGRGAVGLLRGELADAQRGHPETAAAGAGAVGECPQHDGQHRRRHHRTAARRAADRIWRAGVDVPHRRHRLRPRPDPAGPAAIDAAGKLRSGRRAHRSGPQRPGGPRVPSRPAHPAHDVRRGSDRDDLRNAASVVPGNSRPRRSPVARTRSAGCSPAPPSERCSRGCCPAG